ncbi:hypothetical protein MBLNU13_g00272t1 [Cladosporium sp. NU13]
MTCHYCGQTGHKAKNCRSGQNNGGKNNNNNGQRQNSGKNGGKNKGGNNNAPQNQNGGNNNNVDPAAPKPKGPCYLHGPGHRNNECKVGANVWSPKHVSSGNSNNKKKTKNGNKTQSQNQQQQQQQQQQNQNQDQQQNDRPKHENRHGNKRTNNGPISGAEYNYCERCNIVGHKSIACLAPPPDSLARGIITCFQCGNTGHPHTECRHPAFCADCKTLGHSRENCRTAKPASVLLSTRLTGPADWIVPTVDVPSMFAETYRVASPPQHYMPVPQVYPQTFSQTYPQAQPGITKAFFANACGELVLEAPMDEVTSQICYIAAENEAARRQAIATKCCSAHMMYSMKLLNDEIVSGERFFRRVDPSNPQIQLPPNVQTTEALGRLCQFWINDNSFSMAAAFVRKGWNFFRDPRTLDAIARSSTPICHCCSGKGRILSATFTQLLPGTDVLTVEDYDMWGPSVMFSCQCSLSGYSFLQGEDSMEVCWS